MKVIRYLMLILFCNAVYGQDYTSFFTGNNSDASTNPQFGICLMGGASENDNAMQWFLNLADGGDVVVLRASGSDGYNDYMYNQLGVSLNSVETLLINNPAGAINPYVLQKVSQAEAIWFAGGDQADYVNYFKNNDLGDLLNEHINIKQSPIGGISAGMAIMGEFYFDALNGTVTTAEALSNPFDNQVSIGVSDFLDNSILENTITDTHYESPDRKGRHMAFLARLQAMTGERVFGIGLEEFTAACIDQNGIAHIYGDFPNFDDYAYFIQINCQQDTQPENLSPGQNLDWNLNQQAVKAYKVSGEPNGNNQFDLNTWETGIGGEWQNWWVDQGNFQSQISVPIDCDNLNLTEFEKYDVEIYPNPFENEISILSQTELSTVEIFDISGRQIKKSFLKSPSTSLNLEDLSSGLYILRIKNINAEVNTFKIQKK